MADISSGFSPVRTGTNTTYRTRLALPVIIYVFSVVTPIVTNIGGLYLTMTRVVLLVMIVPLIAQLFSGRFGKILLVDYLFFFYISWMTVSMAVVNPDRVVANTGSAAVEFLGAYLVGRVFIRDRSDLIALIRLVGVIVLLTVPLALLETVTGQSIVLSLLNKLPGISSYANINYPKRMGLERAQTIFVHPIHYGLFCSFSFALTYVGLTRVINSGTRRIYGLGISLGVFLSLSSGALLALVLQIFLISWSVIFRKTSRRWLMLFGFFVLIYIVIDLLSSRPPIRVFMSYATFSAHNAYIRSIIFDWGMMNLMGSVAEGIPSAKLFGIGLNDWVRPIYLHSPSMDNFWLLVAVRNGFPAFVALAGGYAWLLWKVGRRDLDGDLVLLDLRLAWMISFVGLTFTLATVHIWGSLYSFVFFMFGAGVWFLTAEPENQTNTPELEPEAPDRSRESYTRFPKGPSSSSPSRGRQPISPRPVTASSRNLTERPAAEPIRTRR